MDERDPATRGLFALRLHPGTEERFERLCEHPSRELIEEAQRAGVYRLTGFRRGTDVWTYGEFRGHPQAALQALEMAPASRQWWREVRDVVVGTEPDDAISTYTEVFHTNVGPPLDGPMTRGILSLVIDPDRAAEYEAMHADPWPELIEALAASGFRRYSGFRRGAHVLYYGEFYPDLPSAFARMATHEVDARWGAAFEGIITSIQSADGKLFTAREVFHIER